MSKNIATKGFKTSQQKPSVSALPAEEVVRYKINNTPENFRIVCLLIAVLCILVYLPGFQNGFVWDDLFYVVNNEDIRQLSLQNLWNSVSKFYLGNWHPLTMLTYYLEYTFAKDSSWVYHFTNTIIHIFNSILVVKLVEKLSKNFLIGSLTGILFAVHPLHVESVIWAAERKDVLYTLFFLLSFLQYLRYTDSLKEQDSINLKHKNLIFSGFLFLLSCLSKGMAVVLPIVLLITDYILLNRKSLYKILIEKIPFLIISLIIGIISIKAQSEAGANASKVINNTFSLSERFFMINTGVLFYWIKMILPFKLLAFYPYPDKDTGSIPSFYYLAFIGIIFLVGLLYWSGRKNRLVWWSGLYFLVVIFPVSQILPVGSALMADRYFYVSSIGPLVLIGILANKIFQSAFTNKISPIIGGILILGLSFLSFKQSTVWKDALSLFSPVHKVYPDDPMINSNLGWYYFRNKDKETAKFYFEETHKTTFKTADVYTALGQIYFDEKKYDLTVSNFEAALKLKPEEMKNLHWMLGAAYYHTDNYPKAIEESQIALDKSDNKNPYAQNIMGLCLAKLGKTEDAIERYRLSAKNNPKFADPYINISTIYNQRGDHSREIQVLEKAIRLDPKAIIAYKNLGVAYKSIGKWQEAIRIWKKGAEVDLKDGSFDYNIGLEYGQHGDIDSGIRSMRSAVAKGDSNAPEFLTQRGIPLK